MVTIDITKLLSVDLKSRSAVSDLRAYVISLHEEHVQIDFSKVEFATRSFIDEYFNTFIVHQNNVDGVKVETVNQPDDIKYMLNVVSRTQTGKKLYVEPANTSVRRLSSLKEMTDFFKTICL